MTALFFLAASLAWPAAPAWLRSAFHDAVPQYADNPPAVLLRNEQVTTVKNNGEVTTVYQHAYRILRPEGRRYGIVQIYFDSETRITFLKAWAIASSGAEYEVKEKDAADTILFSGSIYDDSRQKVLRIPAAEPGAVIGYEYEQRGRPSIPQETWMFQEEVPVREARMVLRLPGGWEHREFWANHPAVQAEAANNQFIWELRDIPAIKIERSMPAWHASAGHLRLAYIDPNGGNRLGSWVAVGQWYAQLVSDRRQSSPELQQKVAELTAGASSMIAKIQALATFVQRNIRYVAVEIGIGGYQPHPALEIFKNRYGDCKDKVTLLSTMLAEIGVQSQYVLINTRRGVVIPEFPSPHFFNHAILAIRPPAGVPVGTWTSHLAHPQMGALLFFDPTDPYVPVGQLPGELQASFGLIVGDSGGTLMKLPLLPARSNQLERTAKLQLTNDGVLQGEIHEIRRGGLASDFRAVWLNASESERRKAVQARFGRQTGVVDVKDTVIKDLDNVDRNPSLSYTFRLAGYSTSAGNLRLVRPRVLAEWSDDILESGNRTHPVELSAAELRTETVEITLPPGFVVDELPSPTKAEIDVAVYSSKSEADGRILRYTRRFEIRDVLVRTDQLSELKKFYRQMAADEKAKVVLRKE